MMAHLRAGDGDLSADCDLALLDGSSQGLVDLRRDTIPTVGQLQYWANCARFQRINPAGSRRELNGRHAKDKR